MIAIKFLDKFLLIHYRFTIAYINVYDIFFLERVTFFNAELLIFFLDR